MGDKSARKESGKTAASMSLKEKRVAKADKKAGKARTEAVTELRTASANRQAWSHPDGELSAGDERDEYRGDDHDEQDHYEADVHGATPSASVRPGVSAGDAAPTTASTPSP